MLIIKLVTLSVLSLAAKYDGGTDPGEFSHWVCYAQGQDESKILNNLSGSAQSREMAAKETAYLKCRFSGYSDCEITTCQQTPHQI